MKSKSLSICNLSVYIFFLALFFSPSSTCLLLEQRVLFFLGIIIKINRYQIESNLLEFQMLIQSLLLSILFLPLFVHSQCYSKSPAIWICTNRSKSIDYQTVLAGENFEKFFLKNYQLTVFQIDRYPPTLRLFNASNNQFERIRITGKNRTSGGNLRQLILQSNQIRYFQRNDIVLPESLEIISLANNRLEILDARIFLSLKKLTKLDLRNNQLKRILPQLFLSRIIRLTNNPLECRCTPEFYRIICEKSTNVIPALVSAVD